MNVKISKNNLIPILFALLGFVYNIQYQLRHGRDMLNSDMSSELLLSDILNKSHGILSGDWFYSTELHVFETQWTLRIGLLLFPENWHYARTVGLILSLIILVAAIYIFVKACELSYLGWWIVAFCMWPFSYWYRFLVTYGIHYIPYMVFTILSVYCIIELLKLNFKTHRNKSLLYIVILGFLSFASGLNGIRQFMVCFAPIMLSGFVMLFVKDDNGMAISRRNVQLFVYSLYSFLVNCFGYLVNMVILSKHYNFTSQDDHIWGGGTESWIQSIKWFFDQFGYCQDWMTGIYNKIEIPLFSFLGISVLAGWIIGAVVFFSLIYLIFKFKNLKFIEQYLVVLFLSMLFVIGFIITYFYSITSQYWIQTVPFGFLMVVIAVKNLPGEIKSIPHKWFNKLWDMRNNIIFLCGALLIVISSRGVTKSYGENPNPEYVKYGLSEVVDWIEENTDYDIGVSEFWTSNIVTELSSGRIEMYTVTDGYSPGVIYPWLQKQSHIEGYNTLNHYFVLCEYDKDRYVTVLNGLPESEIIYSDDRYIVYGVN